MPSIAKNVRSTSGRRRLATVAAGVVLAGGVQLMTADSSWACGGDTRLGGPLPASVGEHVAPDAAFTSAKATATTDGSWNEITVKVTNKTGQRADGAEAQLGFAFLGNGTPRAQDLRVEMKDYTGTWKRLELQKGCYQGFDINNTQRQRILDGQSMTYTFRYALAPSTPSDVTEIQLVTDAWSAGSEHYGATDLRTVKINHPAAPKPTTTTKPTATAKPTAKPTATKPTAKPAADETPAAPAPKATPPATKSTPATTAPAGTPELAQTGSSSANGFLAASAAAFVALGAGVLIAVRRLRPQR
ncbi:hypothetical protein C2142_19660 [Streptomyces sp. CB01881]|nr:hypothetical protein C2142_19660 [Streptomyces sp. CB01881]